jgi:uncharacterized protein YbbC (DUF1343 family)
MKIRFGVDRVVMGEVDQLRDQRLGLVTSNVATTAFNGETSRVALRRAGFNLIRLFGPEHGLSGSAADGTPVTDEIDPATQLPVVSLYGQKLRPPPVSLADLDAVLYDIPDVGARFYTYIWTLSHVMEACAEAGKPLYVLDRPNPIGADLSMSEGSLLDEQNLSSFVGRWDIPIRYSLTIGELAQLWNVERSIGVDLRIVQVAGWQRRQHWPDTRLPFVKLSPAMPSYESALLYPGTCLFEGTSLSEGRGTSMPFQLIGAPWLKSQLVAEYFNQLKLPGVRAQAVPFTPQGRKHAGEQCQGVQLQITDPHALRPVNCGLHLLAQIIRLHADEFRWLAYPTAAAGSGVNHFDKLIGRLDIRPALDAQRSDLLDQINEWTAPANWTARAQPHLLYE